MVADINQEPQILTQAQLHVAGQRQERVEQRR